MIRNYITQAITMMRQHKLFTGIYVASTAISLALAMTLFMVFHIKLAPGYPEYNRNRILIFYGAEFNDVEPLPPTQITKYMGIHLSGGFATEVIADIDGIERIALTASPEMSFDPSNIRTEGSDKCIDWSADAICVDDNYWKTFGFEFISGVPFTKEELNDAKAVISESYARALFARTDVAGEKMILDGHGECTIVGVVKDAPECMELTCYDIFFPLNYINLKGSYDKWDGIHGHYEALITYSPGADVDNIKKEIEERYHRYSQEYIKNEGFTKFDYDIRIYRNWEKVLATGGDSTIWDALKKYFYVVLAFLFIPALNLSGMISSRMNSRLAELGVRKAYGATNAQILWQLLWENLFLTFLGSLIGLALSYIITGNLFRFLHTLITGGTVDYDTPMQMLFSPRIFIVTLLVCVLLNIASALLPAMFALKNNIVQSLYNKR